MNYQIAFGTDTESIEDPNQLVLLTLPDECADMDTDELSVFLDENWMEVDSQPLVGLTEVIDSFLLAMHAEGIDHDTRARIVTTVRDAVDNNS